MITEQPKLNKPVVVSRLQVNDIIALASGRVRIISLTDDYQKNSICAYKTATVEDVLTGKRVEMKFYANMRYYVV
jgi:hypothetical protein